MKNSISDEMKLNAAHFNAQTIYKEIDNQNENILFNLSFNLSNNKRKKDFNEIENETKKIKKNFSTSSNSFLMNEKLKSEEKEILICKMTLTKVLEKLNSLNDLKNLSNEELKNISKLSEEISKKCKF